MIERCMKIWASWTTKVSAERGLADFESAWSTLKVFIDSEPKLELRSEFMWHLYLQTKCSRVKVTCLAVELTNVELIRRFSSEKPHAMQRKYVCVLVTKILGQHSTATSEVTQMLEVQSEALLEVDSGVDYEASLLLELRRLKALVKTSLQVGLAEHLFLKEALAEVEKEQVRVANWFCNRVCSWLLGLPSIR